MDIEMPVMNGYQASENIIKILKEAGDEDYCHIVALTAYTSSNIIQNCLNIGMKEVYQKPFHNKDLQKVIYKHYFRFSNA